METHYKGTCSGMDTMFPGHRVHESRILILKVAAGSVEFAFVVKEDDRFPERTESISGRWDDQ